MTESEISHLYKFRSLSGDSLGHVERTLKHDELYFPRPSEFNDPFDCLPITGLDATDSEFLQYLEGLFKRRSPQMSRAERRTKAKEIVADRKRNHRSKELLYFLEQSVPEATNAVGVLSLAARPDHVLMWTHYADSHRGICLRFKASSTSPFFGKAQRVSYQSERPVLNMIKDDPLTQTNKALLTKADFWSYEQEWRIVNHEQGPGVHRFPTELLDGLIFGIRCEQRLREHIAELAKARKFPVQLYEANLSGKSFGIQISAL